MQKKDSANVDAVIIDLPSVFGIPEELILLHDDRGHCHEASRDTLLIIKNLTVAIFYFRGECVPLITS